MKAGSLPGAVSRTSGGPPFFADFHRHSKPSWVRRPSGVPCQATRKSSAALLAGDLVPFRPAEQIALSAFSFPVPAIFTGKCPDRVGGDSAEIHVPRPDAPPSARASVR